MYIYVYIYTRRGSTSGSARGGLQPRWPVYLENSFFQHVVFTSLYTATAGRAERFVFNFGIKFGRPDMTIFWPPCCNVFPGRNLWEPAVKEFPALPLEGRRRLSARIRVPAPPHMLFVVAKSLYFPMNSMRACTTQRTFWCSMFPVYVENVRAGCIGNESAARTATRIRLQRDKPMFQWCIMDIYIYISYHID